VRQNARLAGKGSSGMRLFMLTEVFDDDMLAGISPLSQE
jgi:hypothetical protein